jgi:hypothetical protein
MLIFCFLQSFQNICGILVNFFAGFYLNTKVKVKEKPSPNPHSNHRGGGGLEALSFSFLTSVLYGVNHKLHAEAALPPEKDFL